MAKHELKPRPTINEELGIDRFIDSLQGKREACAQVKDHVYWNADLEEYLDPVEVEAVRLINEEPKFRLSDALEVYLSGHKKKNDKKFRVYVC